MLRITISGLPDATHGRANAIQKVFKITEIVRVIIFTRIWGHMEGSTPGYVNEIETTSATTITVAQNPMETWGASAKNGHNKMNS